MTHSQARKVNPDSIDAFPRRVSHPAPPVMNRSNWGASAPREAKSEFSSSRTISSADLGLMAPSGAKYAPHNRGGGLTQIPLAEPTGDWPEPLSQQPKTPVQTDWRKQRAIAQARVAALQQQHNQILDAERRQLHLELLIILLTLLGGAGWGIWHWYDPAIVSLPGRQQIQDEVESIPTQPLQAELDPTTPANDVPQPGSEDLAANSTETEAAPAAALSENLIDESDDDSNAIAPGQLKSAQAPSVEVLSESLPRDKTSPLNRIARSSKRPIEGLAASLPPNLDQPVDRNWRIGGYRVSDIYLPCQRADASDCRTQHPVTGYLDVSHWGVDLAMPYGAPLYAVGKEGSDVKVSCYYDGAKGLVGQFSSSSFPAYEFEAFHLSDCIPGVHLAGALVAAVGNSGISNGPHLHWEAYWYGRRVNPPRWSLEFVVKGDIQVNTSNKYVY
ncbi:MAG: M23 family metallopeptidase [Sodalinema sp.]|uniref:M23 family metallopeptidase n=1 Tax=Sodalinema sp. TaxID=3080550 RepID=UPI00121CF025|nr:MAG: M23 family metallopeptidase [Phormidium sp. SL48-SHIP]